MVCSFAVSEISWELLVNLLVTCSSWVRHSHHTNTTKTRQQKTGFKSLLREESYLLRSKRMCSKRRDPSVIPHLYSSCWAEAALGNWSTALRQREQDWLFHGRNADGLWQRALCCPCPLSPMLTPMAFHVPPYCAVSEEEPGHRAGLQSVWQNSLPGHLWKMNSLCAFVWVYWGELCSEHSEETCKSPPEFMGGAFVLSERRNW